MRGSATGSGTPLSSNPRKHSAGIRSAAAVMPTASNTDPEALAPTSSAGSRDLDNEKAVLLGRTGSKNIRAAVSQAPKEVCNLCSHRMQRACGASRGPRNVVLLSLMHALQALHQIVHSWFTRKFGTGW